MWGVAVANDDDDDACADDNDATEEDRVTTTITITTLANPGMTQDSVTDVSTGITIPVCKLVQHWALEIKESESIRGYLHKICKSNIEDEVRARAKPNDCVRDEKRQLKRLLFLHSLSDKYKDKRTMLSLHGVITLPKIKKRLEELEDVDSSFEPPTLKYARNI